MTSRPVGRLAKADDAVVDDCVFDDAGVVLCTSEGLIGVLADEADGVVVVSAGFVGVEGFAGMADSAAEAAAARASL